VSNAVGKALSNDGCNLCHTTKSYLWGPGMFLCLDCRSWAEGILYRREPPLPPIDPEFKVIPDGMKNSQDGLKRYRRYLDSHFPKE
jgi:hypothetical protein